MQLRHKWWRTLLPLLLALGMVLSTAGPSLAVEKRPPRAVLRAHGETVQRGRLGSYCWSYQEPDSDYGVGVCADSIWSFPEAAELRVPARTAIRFKKVQRPRRLGIAAWRDLNRHGYPKGDSERIAYRLRPVRSRGEVVAWDAIFSLREADRHYYIDAFPRWREGSASYTFHVKTTEPK